MVKTKKRWSAGWKSWVRRKSGRFARGLRLFRQRRYRWYGVAVLAVLVAVSAVLAVHHDMQARRYVLSSAAKQLVGSAVPALDKQLHYDAQTNTYRYNPAAASGSSAMTIGGGKYYGVNLAAAASKGQTYTDAATKLSFMITPAFNQLTGKHMDGHIVYPVDGGQVVYTLKDNGLKEDIVLTRPTSSIQFRYKLQLPSDLQARLNSDGSIGIYSADPALFGNITYGNSSDEQAIAQARASGAKTNLVFQIPAPTITQAGGATQGGHATFSLHGNELVVTATDLQRLSYPVAIDPTVIVSSANTFASGNNEDNIAFGASGGISRATISGGKLSSGWTAAGTGYAAENTGMVAYDGYLYEIGGNSDSGTYYTTVKYAAINGGSLGSWQSATSLPAARSYSGVLAYNGYLYVIGGTDGSSLYNQVWYTPISPSGSLGSSWQPATTLTRNLSQMGVAAYNGYLYVIGGYHSTSDTACNTTSSYYCSTVAYTAVKADGSLGSWTTTTALGSGRINFGASVYNGYLYVAGGATDSASYNSDVQYATLGSDGSVGPWSATTSFNVARRYNNLVIYGDYAYVLGGTHASSDTACVASGQSATQYCGDVQVAPVYASGRIGSWTTSYYTDSNGKTGRTFGSTAAYNGYLYSGFGFTAGSGLSGDVATAKIDAFNAATYSGGGVNSWNAATSLAAAAMGLNTVAYNGYVYAIGGCTNVTYNALTSVNCGTVRNTVYYAAICTGPNSNTSAGCGASSAAGSLGTWQTASALVTATYGGATAVYNGYIYLIGGCSQGMCNTYNNTTQRAQIQSNGSLGSWSTVGQTSSAIARFFTTATAYDGYLYFADGGANFTTPVSEMDYAKINSDGSLSTNTCGTSLTWCQATSPPYALYEPALTAYNGYLYMVGGGTSASGSSATTHVNYVPITGPNGSLGTWQTGTSLPIASNGVAVVFSGYLYLAGGANGSGSSNYLTSVEYAPFCDGTTTAFGCTVGQPGSIGSWTTTTSFAAPGRTLFGGAIANGYMYVVGGLVYSTNGLNGNLGITNDVQYAPLQVQPMVAHYSRLIDLGDDSINGSSSGDPTISKYSLLGNSSVPAIGSSAVTFCIRSATQSSPTLGSAACSANPALPVVSSWPTTARYVQFSITLDDSQTGLLTGGSPTAINEFDLSFYALPLRRLRGGQTFTNGTTGQADSNGIPLIQQLDTQGLPQ